MKLLYVKLSVFKFQNRSIRLIVDFGLTYCPNGDLLQYILDADHFELDIVRFYAAEIIEAIEQLHIRKIIHRDLKVFRIKSTKTTNLFHFEYSLAGKYSSLG